MKNHVVRSEEGPETAMDAGHYVFPMSFSQRRLWFLAQLEPDNPSYNTAIAVRITGLLDRDAVLACFNEIVRRHEVLRTTFASLDGDQVQIVALEQSLDLRVVNVPSQDEEVEKASVEEARRPFDLSQGPLIRLCLLHMHDEEHVLVVTLHHIVCDGWSAQILAREFAALYPAMVAGNGSPLAPLSIQYADYAEWQRNWLQGDRLERQRDYWKRQLRGELPVLELPADRPRAAVQTSSGTRHAFAVPASVATGLVELSRREGVSLFMTLLAAFQVLLQRYTGISDVCVGTPVACRTRRETEDLIGFFANTLVLRTDLADNPPCSALLARVREVVIGAQTHQELPFEELVDLLKPARALSHSPLFQVMFVLQTSLFEAVRLPGLQVDVKEIDVATAKFELSLDMVETAQGIEGAFEYNTDLFEKATIDRMTAHFQQILRGIVECPETRVSELPLKTELDGRRMVPDQTGFGNTTPPAGVYADLFEVQVERTPHALAVRSQGQSLTYRELNEEANQVAHALRTAGVGPDVIVAALDQRGIALLTILLGILKAGGAYLPLDPSHPAERWRQLIELSRARVVLTSDEYRPRLPGDTLLLTMEDIRRRGFQRVNPLRSSSPDQLAYVIYTSGSTGVPKGAMVPQRSLMNHLMSKVSMLRLGDGDGIAQTASACFDISIWQFLTALVCGGHTVIVPDDVARDPAALLAFLDKSDATVAETVPVLLQGMLDAASEGMTCPLLALRWMLPTGETLPPQLCRSWFRRYPDIPLMNAYGPAECADDVAMATIAVAPPAHQVCMPIGKPIPHIRLYIVDQWLTQAPIGVAGELCVGGVGVGRGYLQDQARTAESFVPDPFGSEPGSRLYRTGDRARRRPDGSLEFLGRFDHQVKVRGVRIELGEIEARLREQPGVRDAVVVLREDRPGIKQLVGYVVTPGLAGAPHDSWRDALRARLPESMIPACFISMDMLPRNSNGKVDRRALPVPGDLPARAYVAPRTPEEETLAAIWADILGVERIGTTDNFFELGGDSILSLQVVSRATHAGIKLTARQVFQYQTVAELAAHALSGGTAGESGATWDETILIDQETRDAAHRAHSDLVDLYPLTPLQQGLLFHSLYQPRSGVYIEQMNCRIQGDLDVPAFRTAWQRVVERHAVLRTLFMWQGMPSPIQIVAPSAALPWRELDWRDHAEDEREPRLQQLLREDRQTDFDFERAPLMRFTLIRVGPDEHDFLWTHHHILMDGWCLPILLKEVLIWYQAIRGAEAPSFELPVPYRRYIAWQQRQDPVAAEQFWRATLKGFTVPTAIGEDRKADASDEDGSHGIETLTLSAAETAAMQAYARHHHVTLNTLVQGAWALLLSRYSGETDIVFGTTVSGRSADIPGIETIIGLFINPLPLRMPVSPDAIVHRWLRDLLERNSDLRQYEQTPLANIQGWSEVPRGRSLFDSLIVFDNHPMDETVERDPSELVVEDMTLQGQTNYPLTLNVLPGEELTVAFWYQRRRFTQESIRRIVRHFKTLLRSMLENPAARIGELSMMGAAERATVVTQWNATGRPYPTDRTVPEAIVAQAEATPAAIAVRDDAGTLTYGELLARANQVAQALRAQGVGPETFVGIAMVRSVDLVVGLLGILQAGAAYVPLDPTYPSERLAYMLADSQVAALLTQEALVAPLAFPGPTLCLDRDWPAIAQYPETAPPGRFTAEQLAYVIYTSGSTGHPKGAGNSHGGLRNRLQWMQEAYPLTAADRVLQKTPISFDVSVWEFFWPLTVGAELIMAAPDEHKEPAKLIARIVTQGVTTLHFVPPMLQAFLATPGVERCRSLRHLICSGEALPATLPPQVQALLPTVALHNLYGPTEAAIDVTAWTCPQSPKVTAVPIGRPIANLQIYVLDTQGQPVPVGVPGELYIGGAGVARGYHRRPALTAARFVPDPFTVTPGQRLYRTGDLVRYRADGAIEYLGRLDHQVKIRGFRIELGEIEQTLGQQPGIREAVVVARREASGSTRLVAYVTAQAGQELDPLALRQALGRTLPDYMVPAVILPLAQLPLSPNGKVDRKALPAPEAETQRTAAYVAPETETEQRLAAIWTQVLGLPRVGRQDNFFELGGDSINSLQILARAHQEGIKLTPKQLFDHPTIASVAAVAVISNIDQTESVSDMGDPSRIADVDLTDDEMQNLLEEIG